MAQTILLELNEINFDYVRYYADRGFCPNLKALLDRHTLCRTTSEAHYEELEPWIQWVTAHTGKTLSEHAVFRLGDIVDHDIEQIWEQLEAQGVTVGAVSPLNAKNRTSNACFFVPDPWTNTGVTGSYLLKKLYGAISQAVNDNSQARLAISSVFWLAVGALVYARPSNYRRYASLAFRSRKHPWKKSMFLDLLLADVFIKLTKRKNPEFASLFVNAGAHIQHHYMFNSPAYDGKLRNPSWYVSQDDDPLLDVYSLYDNIVKDMRRDFEDARLVIVTGLHQDPHPETTFYWRLKDHAAFLNSHGLPFESVEPRMSRDFLVRCASEADGRSTGEQLAQMHDKTNIPLFEVDNRGSDLFVMLTYPCDIPEDFEYSLNERSFTGLRGDVAFVAIKNGRHNGIGYFIDCGRHVPTQEVIFPLSELPARIKSVVLG